MSEQNDTTNVSMANTKKEMLEAYLATKKRLQKQEKEVLNAEKARKQIEKQLAEATADSQVSQDPLQRLYKLKGDIGRELTTLAEKFEQEIDTYRKIQTAVKEKKEELDTLYEIETAASDLAALIEAQQEKKETFEREMEIQRSVFEEEIQEARTKWNKEKYGQELATKDQAEAIKKQRQRENEEYEYAFAREQELRKNALDDELRTLEKEIEQKRKDFEQELNQRNIEIEAREKAVSEKESEISRLREEVETFPQKLENKVNAAVEATTERLTSDFEKAQTLLEAKFAGEKNVLSSKIESLDKLVKTQEAQIAELSKRHELAYEKVQDIANRAVAAAKREFISVPITTRSTPDQNDRNKS